jgi:hypothetical protein
MRETHEYALRPLEQGEGEARSMLSRNGVETGLIVPGCVLEAQFACATGALLFITHDIPFEEQLDICLVEGAVLKDRASLYGAYSTGDFRNVAIAGEDRVTFDFFGGHRWQARVFARPEWRLPGVTSREPAGVHRGLSLSCHFAVETAR